ncbi:MAG TPA: delta-60 repeat domain-containing protein, partial [Actinoplanes sp.]|nr:delta-60 repeat domain-containing protein [Actinoplanes sp.]
MIVNTLARKLAVVAVPAVLLTGLVTAPAQAAGLPPVTSRLVTANPADNTPHALNGAVHAFAEIGDTVYVGGSFTSIRTAASSTAVARSYLFAYSRSTGALVNTFRPVLGGTVQALEVSPDGKLLVGGAFKTVNGVARKNLVQLDPVTGETTAWAGVSDGGLVRRIVRSGDSIYVAGGFHYINGRRHSLLARLNATTGAVDQSFQVDASVARVGTELVWGMAVSPDGRTLVAVGNFTIVNGQARNQVVLVDLAGTPAVADWSTTRYELPCGKSFPF